MRFQEEEVKVAGNVKWKERERERKKRDRYLSKSNLVIVHKRIGSKSKRTLSFLDMLYLICLFIAITIQI